VRRAEQICISTNLLHDFCITHGLVDSRKGTNDLRHDVLAESHRVGFALEVLVGQFIEANVGVDFLFFVDEYLIWFARDGLRIFTMAKRLSNPLTLVGTLENFWSNASDILWAGSVDMIRTLSRTLDSWTARLELQQNDKKY
jgi:hypothetical protein